MSPSSKEDVNLLVLPSSCRSSPSWGLGCLGQIYATCFLASASLSSLSSPPRLSARRTCTVACYLNARFLCRLCWCDQSVGSDRRQSLESRPPASPEERGSRRRYKSEKCKINNKLQGEISIGRMRWVTTLWWKQYVLFLAGSSGNCVNFQISKVKFQTFQGHSNYNF